jgi:hypothetical protein
MRTCSPLKITTLRAYGRKVKVSEVSEVSDLSVFILPIVHWRNSIYPHGVFRGNPSIARDIPPSRLNHTRKKPTRTPRAAHEPVSASPNGMREPNGSWLRCLCRGADFASGNSGRDRHITDAQVSEWLERRPSVLANIRHSSSFAG